MRLLALFMDLFAGGLEISPGGAVLLTVFHGDRQHQAWLFRTGMRRVLLKEVDARPRGWLNAVLVTAGAPTLPAAPEPARQFATGGLRKRGEGSVL